MEQPNIYQKNYTKATRIKKYSQKINFYATFNIQIACKGIPPCFTPLVFSTDKWEIQHLFSIFVIWQYGELDATLCKFMKYERFSHEKFGKIPFLDYFFYLCNIIIMKL